MSRSRIRYPVKGVTEAPRNGALRIRTRLYCSERDLKVVGAMGEYFDHLCSTDLAMRCRPITDEMRAICALAGFIGLLTRRYSGRVPSAETVLWAIRKQRLTAKCSSRYAGWITKSSNDAYNLAMRNQQRALVEKNKAIQVIAKKLKLPVHTKAERKALIAAEAKRAKDENRRPQRLVFGYQSPHEHAMKRRRLEHLQHEATQLQRDIAAGALHITRGGKKLLHTRLHLEEAGLSENAWRAKWDAKRRRFGANGESGKCYGNSTIQVTPDGIIEMVLPPDLQHLANVPRQNKRESPRYRFDAKAQYPYRQDEWRFQVGGGRAVAYEVLIGENGRVYLDASFTPDLPVAVPSLEDLLSDPDLRVLALDLNHGFLAPAILDRAGNPISRIPHIPFVTEDLPATTRDGHLRQLITEVLNLADHYECKLIVVENLGFHEMRATGRERYRSAKWFRKVVCGIPTRQFRDRLVPMASRHGILVVGVPAGYSSIWGKEYWQEPLSTKSHKVSGHTAAAVVLGRRALGYRARRRAQASPGVTAPDQRIEEAGQPAGVGNYHVLEANGNVSELKGTSSPPRHEGFHHSGCVRSESGDVRPEVADVRREAPRLAKTVRASRVSLRGT
jgi:hypothetical protein